MIFIIGGNGFVGSGFARRCVVEGREYTVITRENYEAHRGKACSILVNANGNSKKNLPREQPLLDFDLSVRSVRASLVDFRYDTYIYLSTCDVYPNCADTPATVEDAAIDVSRISPYGFHKLIAEQCVRHAAKRHLIFRMGGFVGPGMKKNAIFDILRGGPLWLDPESELQYIHTERLADSVLQVAQEVANETFNIAGKGTIRLRSVIEMVGKPIPVNRGSPCLRCEIDLRKVSAIVQLPETDATVRDFVRDQLHTGRCSSAA